MTWHEILNIVLFNIKTILKITVIASILIFLVLMFVYPRVYDSTVVVLPPEKNTSLGGLGSLLSSQDLPNLITGNLSGASSQLYVEILKSRSASEYVIRKLNLQSDYDEDNFFEAARKLSEDLNIDVNKEGVIKLSVDVETKLFPLFFGDENYKKKISADLSNSFVEALDRINRNKLSSKSRRARIFIEGQLNETKIKLDSVEIALMVFQKKNKTISLPDQLKIVIESAAKIKSEIIKTELELQLLQFNLKEDNASLIALRRKLVELKIQYDKMEMGNSDYLIAFKDVPEIGRELAIILREVKIQNEVYMLLQQQYYKEKIQENRDLPTVEVLDEAIPPIKKSSPKIVYSTFSSSILIFLLVSMIFIYRRNKLITNK